MSKARNTALANGISIGCGLGVFGIGLLGRYFFHHLAEEHLEEYLGVYPAQDTELLMHVASLKETGYQMLLICVIGGIVLLALGIGNEAYERAKRQNT